MPWRAVSITAAPLIALAVAHAPIDPGPADDAQQVSTEDVAEHVADAE